MERKYPAMLAALSLAVLLAACGGGGEPPPDVQPGMPQTGAGEPGGEDTEFIEPGEAPALPTEGPTFTPRPTSRPLAPGMPTIPPALSRSRGTPEAEEGGAGEGISVEVTGGESAAEAWQEIYAAEAGTPFTLTLSAAALEAALAEQIEASDASAVITDISVTMEETVLVAFQLTLPGTTAAVDASIDFDVYASEGGLLVVDVLRAEAAGQQVPEEFVGVLSTALEQAAAGGADFTGVEGGASFTDVTIADGELVVSGVVE